MGKHIPGLTTCDLFFSEKNRNVALLENSAGVKSNANFKVNVTVAYAPKTKTKNF